MTTVLVDGSNVARSDAWAEVMRRERGEFPHEFADVEADPRARLLDWIAYWRTHSGDDVVMVFDGAGPLDGGRRQWDHGYLVVASGSEDGDAVVEAEATRLAATRVAFRLVTNDRALANVAGANAEAVLSVEAFVTDLLAEPAGSGGAASGGVLSDQLVGHGSEPTARRVSDELDDDVIARLERMRRGLEP